MKETTRGELVGWALVVAAVAWWWVTAGLLPVLAAAVGGVLVGDNAARRDLT